MDGMGSEESFGQEPGQEPVAGVPMTEEERLLRRLSEVERFVTKISAELRKDTPCNGVIRPTLLELELGALERDRESIETKLGALLSSFAVAPKDGFYAHTHRNSPNHFTPETRPRPSTSCPVSVETMPEHLQETHPLNIAGETTVGRPSFEQVGNRDHARTKAFSNINPPELYVSASPGGGRGLDEFHSPSDYEQHGYVLHSGVGNTADGVSCVGDGDTVYYNDGQRANFPSSSSSSSTFLAGKGHERDSFSQREHRRTGYDMAGRGEDRFEPAHHHHQQQQQQQQQRRRRRRRRRHDRSRWTDVAPHGAGAENGTGMAGSPRHSLGGTGKLNVAARTSHPHPPDGFYDRSPNRGYFSQEMSGGITQEFGRREPHIHEWGASRSRSCQGQRGEHSSNNDERGEKSSKEGGRSLGAASSGVSNLLHAAAEDSKTRQRGALPPRPPAPRTPPTRSALRPPRFYGHSFRDREGLDRHAPFYEAPYHEASFRAAPYHEEPPFPDETHRAKKRFRDTPYSDRRCVDKSPFRDRDRKETNGGSSNSGGRQASTSTAGCVMDQGITGERGARSTFGNTPGSVPVAMAANFAATVDGHYYIDSCEAENEHTRRRFMERSRQMDYRHAYDHRGDLHTDSRRRHSDNRHVDGSANQDSLSSHRTGSQKSFDNSNDPADIHDSHVGSQSMESRGHPGELYREGHGSEHHKQRPWEGHEPHGFPHPEGRIYPSGGGSDWVRGKLGGNGRTAHPPTH